MCPGRPSQAAQEAAAHIFWSFVHARVLDVAAGADEDEDEGEAEGEGKINRALPLTAAEM